MKSNIQDALSLRYPPLAIFLAEKPPEETRPVKGACAMFWIAQAAKGETVALSLENCHCPGSGAGFALQPMRSDNFPGGRECWLRFLSVGNENWEQGRAVIEQLKQAGAPKIMITEFSEGEGFRKTPELVAAFTDNLPQMTPEAPHVVIKPINRLKPGETPKVVSFLVDPDQLSALVVLANFARPDIDAVRTPFGAGCMTFGLYPFFECGQENPRAVVGLTDISARFYLRKILGADILSFTVPLSLFDEMDANVPESFLTRFAWKSMMGGSSENGK